MVDQEQDRVISGQLSTSVEFVSHVGISFEVLGFVDEDVADATALIPRAATATPALVLGAVAIPLRTFPLIA